MVMLRQSVHLTTPFFLDKLDLAVDPYFVHILSLQTDKNPAYINRKRRMTLEIIS